MARRNMKIGDLFSRRPGDEPWRYPFADVKHEQGEGYYIIGEPIMLARAETGDKVADHAISDRPYWVVSFVDEATGRIWLDPIGDNPYLTGVGAGGARLSDYDWKALSGEAAKELIDRALERVSSRCVTEYYQLVPLLKGWVPPFFGPNGRQGGGYGVNWTYTVGAREGLSPEEIVVKDAQAIKRFGIDVPTAALRGDVAPRVWQEFIAGHDDNLKELVGTELEGEDWRDPDSAIAMVLRHPMGSIKTRNWTALMSLREKSPREIVRGMTSPERWSDPEWVKRRERIYDEVHERWERGEYRNKALDRRIRELALEVRSLSHPRCSSEEDPYASVRLLAVKAAATAGWLDVLRSYESDPNPGVRDDVVWAWRARRDEASLRRMEAVETHPKPLNLILYGLYEIGVDPLDVVDADQARYCGVLATAGEDSWLGTNARALDEQIRSWRSQKRTSFLPGGWERELGRNRERKGNPSDEPVHVGEDGRTSCCGAYTSISMDDMAEYCKKCFRVVEGYVGEAAYAPAPKRVDVSAGHVRCEACSKANGCETFHPRGWRCRRRRPRR